MATALSPEAIQSIWNLTTYGKSIITDGYTITNYPINGVVGDTFTIPAITPSDVFLGDDEEDEDPWGDDEENDDEYEDTPIHDPNSVHPIYSEASLEKYRTVLKPDVFDKFLHFFDTKATVTEYSAIGKKYVTAQIYPHQAGEHSFWYSSDELPYVAKVRQPCFGQLGGIKPGQTNLYLWVINYYNKSTKEAFNPLHPFYKFFKELRDGMFMEGVLEDVQDEALSKYGFMMTPKLLESWSSPVIAGFVISFRDDWSMKESPLESMLSQMLHKGYSKANPWVTSSSDWGLWRTGTWQEIKNLMSGTFNKSIMSLPSYAVDPDYSCWDSPLNNLWSDLDIQSGGKVITGRATDMVWDPWVVRNRENSNFYGRNDGHSRPVNDGEVQKDLKIFLNLKEPKTYEEAQELVRQYVTAKVTEDGTTGESSFLFKEAA